MSTPGKLEKYACMTTAYFSGIFFKLARCGYTLRVTSQASSIYILGRISKIFSIFLSEMFTHLKKDTVTSFLYIYIALYNEYTV
jgi:hypothetical protein